MTINMSMKPSIKISSAIRSYSASLSMPKYRYLSSSYKHDSDSQNCYDVMLDGFQK